MLYVILNNKKQLLWETTDPTHKVLNESDNIQTIMASGKELELIKTVFGNSIPMPVDDRTDIIWYGDIAKTIISNIMI